ncbi:hypothetical protein EIG84_12825 [Flavobacteriaceae bacterium 14752]|nr:hypothetical protein EIG84_12825 [Flavobacteriaceae bacterium 14752]
MYNLIKFPLLFFTLSLFLVGCTSEEINDGINQNVKNKTSRIIIETDDALDVSHFYKDNISFNLDTTKDSYIDLNTSLIYYPVVITNDLSNSIYNLNKISPEGVCITIASRKPRPDRRDCKKPCQCGIGFRCRIFNCDDDGNPIPEEPILQASVAFDEESSQIILEPQNEIEWESL